MVVQSHLLCLLLSWTASLWIPEADLSWPLFTASLISLVEVSLDLESICHIPILIPGGAQGQVGWVFGQPDVVGGIPAHGMELEPHGLTRTFPIQTIRWLCCCSKKPSVQNGCGHLCSRRRLRMTVKSLGKLLTSIWEPAWLSKRNKPCVIMHGLFGEFLSCNL